MCSHTPGNYRPVQIWFDANGHIKTPHRIHAAYQPETWYDMAVDIAAAKQAYRLALNGKDISGWLHSVSPAWHRSNVWCSAPAPTVGLT